MATLTDNFRAVNSESGIVVTFERISRTRFRAVWSENGVRSSHEYSEELLHELFDEGYLFKVSDAL